MNKELEQIKKQIKEGMKMMGLVFSNDPYSKNHPLKNEVNLELAAEMILEAKKKNLTVHDAQSVFLDAFEAYKQGMKL